MRVEATRLRGPHGPHARVEVGTMSTRRGGWDLREAASPRLRGGLVAAQGAAPQMRSACCPGGPGSSRVATTGLATSVAGAGVGDSGGGDFLRLLQARSPTSQARMQSSTAFLREAAASFRRTLRARVSSAVRSTGGVAGGCRIGGAAQVRATNRATRWVAVCRAAVRSSGLSVGIQGCGVASRSLALASWTESGRDRSTGGWGIRGSSGIDAMRRSLLQRARWRR